MRLIFEGFNITNRANFNNILTSQYSFQCRHTGIRSALELSGADHDLRPQDPATGPQKSPSKSFKTGVWPTGLPPFFRSRHSDGA